MGQAMNLPNPQTNPSAASHCPHCGQPLIPATSAPSARTVRKLLPYGLLLLFLGVIAAVAIPNLMRSRMASGEGTSVGGVRTINTAQVTYASTYPKRGFSPTLKALGPPPQGAAPSPDAAYLIDSVLASGMKSGYRFYYQPTTYDASGAATGYMVLAIPMDPGVNRRFLYSDQSGVIHSEMDTFAGPNSPAIQ
ncbi:MAG TPA: hypothetical protein VLE48_06215 [Terriglobales bacterium]|nr:hypothetical protein [Terriglobales bacterium]